MLNKVVQAIGGFLVGAVCVLVAFLLTVFVMEYTALFLLLAAVCLALVWWISWFPKFYE